MVPEPVLEPDMDLSTDLSMERVAVLALALVLVPVQESVQDQLNSPLFPVQKCYRILSMLSVCAGRR